MDNWAGNRDGYLKNNIRADFDRYINPDGQMTFLSYAERTPYRTMHDYFSIIVSKINDPPFEPTIDGPTRGVAGIELNYTINAEDPDGNDVYYFIDWDDGNAEEWIGPYSSGADVSISHTWEDKGNYEIKVKAKDTYDDESDWTELWIKIPRYRGVNNPLLHWLLEKFPILSYLLNLVI
jgi:hypothetical protein